MNQLTEATVLQPSPPTCYIPPQCLDEAEADDSGASDESGGDGVSILAQAQVGPYDMVQLESSDGSALTQWLTAHGYQIPASTKPIIDACVTQGFNLLALKLVPGVGVQSMQPVRVTSQGAAPSLPLRMVAVGTGPTTGITVWVVADGRWAPTSFPTFTIDPSEIVWDWTTSSSNYETLRLAREASYMGSGLQIESSLELNQGGISSPSSRTSASSRTPDAGPGRRENAAHACRTRALGTPRRRLANNMLNEVHSVIWLTISCLEIDIIELFIMIFN